jgi:hypothetical protein
MQAFGNFGLIPHVVWNGTGSNNIQYSSQSGIYSAWIRQHAEGAGNPANAASLVPTDAGANIPAIPPANAEKEEAHYYKIWHWFFRYAMAGRMVEGMRRAMWNMARLRIQDMMTAGVRIQTTQTIGSQTTPVNLDLRLGQLVTSERGVAILLRWHVWRPSHVFGPNLPGVTPRVRNAITNAISTAQTSTQNSPGLDWNLPPEQWTDHHESKILQALRSNYLSLNNSTYDEVYNWPGTLASRQKWALKLELGALSSARNSFHFFHEGI